MSGPIENAQEFVTWCLGNLELDPDAPSFVAAVEARDRAIRIALLNELVVTWAQQPLTSSRPFLDAVNQIGIKYGAK